MIGPELEVSGYGCEDHFYELDTITHSWELIAEILKIDLTNNILCDIGLLISYQEITYNSRVFLYNRMFYLFVQK